MAELLEIPIDQIIFRSSQANDQLLSASRSHGIVLGGGGTFPEDLLLRIRFESLTRQWKKDTAHISSIAKTAMHPAYQAIIGMGEKALPLIFADLRAAGGHWFWALSAITQEDPARDEADFGKAVQVWLGWARERGYLP